MSLHDITSELMTVLMRCTDAEYAAAALLQFKEDVRAQTLNEAADKQRKFVLSDEFVCDDWEAALEVVDLIDPNEANAPAAVPVPDETAGDETGEADAFEYGLRTGPGDVWLKRHLSQEDRERLLQQGAVKVRRTVRYGAWAEVQS